MSNARILSKLSQQVSVDSSGNVGVGTSTPSQKLAVAGSIATLASAGSPSLDMNGTQLVLANGATVNFPNGSGLLIVNNFNNGNVTIFLCGGGATAIVGTSDAGAKGSLAYNAGISGYTWTSNYGSSATYSFFFLRTRPTA